MSAVQFQRATRGSRVTRQPFRSCSKLPRRNGPAFSPKIVSVGARMSIVEGTRRGLRSDTRRRPCVHHKVLVACAVEARPSDAWKPRGQAKEWPLCRARSAGGRADRSARSLCKFVDGAVAPGTLNRHRRWSGFMVGLRKVRLRSPILTKRKCSRDVRQGSRGWTEGVGQQLLTCLKQIRRSVVER